jgi:hypothetical protein
VPCVTRQSEYNTTSQDLRCVCEWIYFNPSFKWCTPCQVGHWAREIRSQVVPYESTFIHSQLIIKSLLADVTGLSFTAFDCSQHINKWNHPCNMSLLVSDAPKEQSVFIMLNGEESELCFINVANSKVRRIILCISVPCNLLQLPTVSLSSE